MNLAKRNLIFTLRKKNQGTRKNISPRKKWLSEKETLDPWTLENILQLGEIKIIRCLDKKKSPLEKEIASREVYLF